MINKNNLTKLLGLLLLLGFVLFNYFTNNTQNLQEQKSSQTQQKQKKIKQGSSSAQSSIEEAFRKKQSDLQVSGSGIVLRLLKDDTNGHKHQKFLLRLVSGQTILIAHNIDLAPKINSLQEGDEVAFYGEYEYNPKGGVVHWTHHDPQKRHTNGWLKHNGKTYQ